MENQTGGLMTAEDFWYGRINKYPENATRQEVWKIMEAYAKFRVRSVARKAVEEEKEKYKLDKYTVSSHDVIAEKMATASTLDIDQCTELYLIVGSWDKVWEFAYFSTKRGIAYKALFGLACLGQKPRMLSAIYNHLNDCEGTVFDDREFRALEREIFQLK